MLKNKKIKKNWGKDDATILAFTLDKLQDDRIHITEPEKLVIRQLNLGI